MHLKDIATAAYENSVNKGFHTNADGTPKERNVGEEIALIHSEVSEALEEARKNADLSHKYYTEDARGNMKPEGFLPEIADIIIRLGDTLGAHGLIDMLEAAVEEKHAYNLTRPPMHGKLF